MPQRLLTPEQEITLVQEYQGGLSLERLALRFGCSAITARNTLLRRGVARRPCGLRPNPIAPTKTCSSCLRDLPRKLFYRNGRRSSECCDCFLGKQTARYWSDSAYRENRLEMERRRRTGWGSGNFEAMWQAQNGLCAICQVPMCRKGRAKNSVHADHDHSSGQTRGLLCSDCNRGLGCFKDSQANLLRAIAYLDIHQKDSMKTGT